jgi:hypothetical protein
MPNADVLADARLSFSQLLSVVQATRTHLREQWIWVALRKLNGLRNEYAHRLASEKLAQKQEDFIKSTNPWITPPDGTEGLLRLKFILLILCAQLANICHDKETAGSE